LRICFIPEAWKGMSNGSTGAVLINGINNRIFQLFPTDFWRKRASPNQLRRFLLSFRAFSSVFSPHFGFITFSLLSVLFFLS